MSSDFFLKTSSSSPPSTALSPCVPTVTLVSGGGRRERRGLRHPDPYLDNRASRGRSTQLYLQIIITTVSKPKCNLDWIVTLLWKTFLIASIQFGKVYLKNMYLHLFIYTQSLIWSLCFTLCLDSVCECFRFVVHIWIERKGRRAGIGTGVLG